MILTLDNLDGSGAIDYSAAISADAPLTIERALGAPSRCTGALLFDTVATPGLPVPSRNARAAVSSDSGTRLFTGSLALEPAPLCAGAGLAGPVYRYEFTAISDEPLFDRHPADLLATSGITHALNFDDQTNEGKLQIAPLSVSQARELASDVTLSGEIEPGEYVTEMFSGDGTTAIFQLSNTPFAAAKPHLLAEAFAQPAINPAVWNVTDPGSHLSLGGGGLMLSGGNGYDGQTTLTAIEPIELGGSLLVEAANVQLAVPSDGVLCGLYSGPVQRANCFAGYNVRQDGAATVVTPMVSGAEAGVSFTIQPGRRYTLRIRLHAPEMQRALQTYRARVDGVIQSFGGGIIDSPVSLVFDIVDPGNASNTPATVLYDGTVPTSPAHCIFGAVNSVQLAGSVGTVSITRNGSAWCVSRLPGGATCTRLQGLANQGVDYQLSATGMITFFPGRVPLPGELVTVLYRTRARAVARLQNDANGTVLGAVGTARWLGNVVAPLARCTADTESAAQAVLALAGSRSVALGGTYTAINPPADISPGDVLRITAGDQTLNTVVRHITVTDGHSVPELITYRIAFANDWTESLGITLSESIATDAYLPPAVASAPAQALANFNALTVTSATATALQIDAGVDPPSGGGFEVRLRDWEFSPNPGPSLVLRSPVRSFSIPRAAQSERFVIRMFDGGTPRLYSRQSAGIYGHTPVA